MFNFECQLLIWRTTVQVMCFPSLGFKAMGSCRVGLPYRSRFIGIWLRYPCWDQIL